MPVATKERTLQFEVSSDEDTLLRAGAEATHMTLTDFVLRPALNRAAELISESQSIIVPQSEFDAMLAALDEPVKPIGALVLLARRPRRFDRV